VGQARNKSGIKVENILTKGKCIFIEITKNHKKKKKKNPHQIGGFSLVSEQYLQILVSTVTYQNNKKITKFISIFLIYFSHLKQMFIFLSFFFFFFISYPTFIYIESI